MLFREIKSYKKHSEEYVYFLRRDDEEIQAHWDGYHKAYDCKVTTYRLNEETGEDEEYKNDVRLLTDTDLEDAEVIDEWEV